MVLESRIGHEVACPTCQGSGSIGRSTVVNGPGIVKLLSGAGSASSR